MDCLRRFTTNRKTEECKSEKWRWNERSELGFNLLGLQSDEKKNEQMKSKRENGESDGVVGLLSSVV